MVEVRKSDARHLDDVLLRLATLEDAGHGEAVALALVLLLVRDVVTLRQFGELLVAPDDVHHLLELDDSRHCRLVAIENVNVHNCISYVKLINKILLVVFTNSSLFLSNAGKIIKSR